MKEYLVHIEIEDKETSHKLIFRSSTLTVLFLAIDDFRKTISNIPASDTSMITDTQDVLRTLSNNFESQWKTVDEQDRMDEQQQTASPTMKERKTKKDEEDDEQQRDESGYANRVGKEPRLKISYPGAE